MLGEHSAAEGVDFAERDGSHSGPLEPEAEPADSREEVEDIQEMPPKIAVDMVGPLGLW